MTLESPLGALDLLHRVRLDSRFACKRLNLDAVLAPQSPASVQFFDIDLCTRVPIAPVPAADQVDRCPAFGAPGIRLLDQQRPKTAHEGRAQLLDAALRQSAVVDRVFAVLRDDAGIDLLNPIQWRCAGMDREGLKRDFGERLVFHGGVDNQQTLAFGSPEDVRREVLDNLAILGKGGGYIPAPCHNLQAISPPENIVAMYEAGYEYGWT